MPAKNTVPAALACTASPGDAARSTPLCPAEYRRFAGLRRHVVVLARFAVLHVEAQQAATRRGLSEVRADLKDVASQAVVEAAVQTFQLEDARLASVRREVGLVEEALRGRRYRLRL